MTKKEHEVRADEPLHKKDVKKIKPKPTEPKPEKPEKEKPEPEAFVNKYGFLHVDKDLAERLGLKFGKDQANTP